MNEAMESTPECPVASGLLLVDKPAGMTSFAVVNTVRKSLLQAFPHWVPRRPRGGPRPARFKCGHAGTLDPLATGLLVVLVGKASRLSQFLVGLDKTYAATVRFGVATDTLDADGEVVATAPVPHDAAALDEALARFRGDIEQVPPLVSALKRDGQPLYKRVRAGEDVAEPAARRVTIQSLELAAERLADPEPEVDLIVACSSGTYIRSLARDLARALGSEGHVRRLRRLRVGPFAVDGAVDAIAALDGQQVLRRLRPISAALPHLPCLELTPTEAAGIQLGHQPHRDWLERLSGPPVANRPGAEALFCLVDPDGDLVAVGRLGAASAEPRIAAVIPRSAAGS